MSLSETSSFMMKGYTHDKNNYAISSACMISKIIDFDGIYCTNAIGMGHPASINSETCSYKLELNINLSWVKCFVISAPKEVHLPNIEGFLQFASKQIPQGISNYWGCSYWGQIVELHLLWMEVLCTDKEPSGAQRLYSDTFNRDCCVGLPHVRPIGKLNNLKWSGTK